MESPSTMSTEKLNANSQVNDDATEDDTLLRRSIESPLLEKMNSKTGLPASTSKRRTSDCSGDISEFVTCAFYDHDETYNESFRTPRHSAGGTISPIRTDSSLEKLNSICNGSDITAVKSESSDQSIDELDRAGDIQISQSDSDRGLDASTSYQRDEGNKDSHESSNRFSRPQILTFISLAITTLLDQVSFSVLAPFFPREAKNRGVSSLQVGLIFGAFALVNVVFSPIFGKYLPKLGAKFTFVAGIWIVAGCNILFGVCDGLTSPVEFIIFCYVIRSLAAVGTSACVTASMTIVANTFPDHVATTVGLLETFSGFGYMLGPVIGGLLYEVGGRDYKVPFIALGCANLVCVFVNLILLPSTHCPEKQSSSITSFLRIPSVWPVGLVIFVGSGAFGFLDPTLSLHVEVFTRSATIVGLLFLLAGGCYAISSPIWGYLAEQFKISRLLVILGSIMSAVAFLLMGPSPLLDLPNELWIICVSLFLAGVFVSASVIASFTDFYLAALKNDLPNDMSTQAVVSGIYNSVYSLGNFVGPSVGGVMMDTYGFDWSVTILAGIQILVAIILALFTLSEFCCSGRSSQRPSSPRRIMTAVNDTYYEDSFDPFLKYQV
ncbi:MFS-type transporter SLC18B1-like [Diadema antillarum]|uniref:MFS-type transporter SLC18B1-like n=1 Tax=Diadema antillarum TaxID=105358 RepID=UPI003A86BE56